MGMFVNPDNSAFQFALNSEIYVDKTGIEVILVMIRNWRLLLFQMRKLGRNLFADLIS